MPLHTKILATLGVFVFATFVVESLLILSVRASQLRGAAGIEVRHVSGRLALAVERAGRPGPLPSGEALTEFLAVEIREATSPPEQSGVRPGTMLVTLVDPSLPAGRQMLASVGAAGEEAEVTSIETLSVDDHGAAQPRRLDLVVAAPAMGIGGVVSLTYGWLLGAALATFALGYALLFLLGRAFIRPVVELRRAVQNLSDGYFDTEIAVSTGDELQGLARAFSVMQEKLKGMQALALDANPLTGLPGNATIQRSLESYLARDDRVAVAYVDLDNFKAYNDAYGFSRADELIRFTGSILGETTAEHDEAAFVGHVGGDDFVFTVRPDVVRAVGDEVIARFDSGISRFYSAEDLARGYVIAKDRQHVDRRLGVAAVSIACVVTGDRKFGHIAELLTALSELKSAAKSKEGSVFLLDRRHETPRPASEGDDNGSGS